MGVILGRLRICANTFPFSKDSSYVMIVDQYAVSDANEGTRSTLSLPRQHECVHEDHRTAG
jgi:hypothetical protein